MWLREPSEGEQIQRNPLHQGLVPLSILVTQVNVEHLPLSVFVPETLPFLRPSSL